MEWEKCTEGEIPCEAFETGAMDHGEPVYIARARHSGSLVPGKTVKGHSHCYVAWGGEEHSKREYEVLLNLKGLHWVKMGGCGGETELPQSAVAIGHEDGYKLYAIKAQVDGEDVLGKYHPRYSLGYLPYDGAEHEVTEFEILCW